MIFNKQRWIAFDQWVHTLVYPDAMADETYSARCWRELTEQPDSPWFQRRVRFIDALFLKLFDDISHCKSAYLAEVVRAQLPNGYRGRT